MGVNRTTFIRFLGGGGGGAITLSFMGFEIFKLRTHKKIMHVQATWRLKTLCPLGDVFLCDCSQGSYVIVAQSDLCNSVCVGTPFPNRGASLL
jgi:hypothetical protein